MSTRRLRRQGALALLMALIILLALAFGSVLGTARGVQPLTAQPTKSSVVLHSQRGATFRAATWNVYFGTPVKVLKPQMQARIDGGVSLFLMQEAGGSDITAMVKSFGYRTYLAPSEYRVAWDPKVWSLREGSARSVRLANTPWHSTGGHTPLYADAARLVLVNKATGQALKVISYHLAPHVQWPGNTVPDRVRSTHEAMADLSARAKISPHVDAVLFGGDDNVDEFRGYGAHDGHWNFMLEPATGLWQVQAPVGTHGKRKIDDFRIVRADLTPVGLGHVYPVPAPDDHNVYVQDFAFVG